MDVELRHLRHVQVLAEQRTFAKAAVALGLSQPALSRSIQEIERRVGVALFRRQRSGVEVTDAGRVLIQRAEPLLAEAAELERQMRQLRGLDVGLLRIGAGTYPSQMFVASAVARMVREHPGIAIEVRTRCADEQFAALRRHEIDLAIADGPWACTQSDLAVTMLNWHRGHLVVRAEHPLATKSGIDWVDVCDHPLVMSPRVPPEILTELRAAASTPDRPVLIGCDTTVMMRSLVLESDAIAVLPWCLVADDIEGGRMVSLPLAAPWMGRAFGIVRLATRKLSGAEEIFDRLLVDADRAAAARAPSDGTASRVEPQSCPMYATGTKRSTSVTNGSISARPASRFR